MPNRAICHFEELQLHRYAQWYDTDTLKYLLHSAPKSYPCFRYVFTNPGLALLDEWQKLVVVVSG